MNAAHVRAEAAINTRNGFTVDFADFAIGSEPDGADRERAVTVVGAEAPGGGGPGASVRRSTRHQSHPKGAVRIIKVAVTLLTAIAQLCGGVCHTDVTPRVMAITFRRFSLYRKEKGHRLPVARVIKRSARIIGHSGTLWCPSWTGAMLSQSGWS